MEIVFSKQNHQQKAIENIMQILSPCMDNGEVNINGLENSLKEFYKSENGEKIAIKNITKNNNIDILMETGTGKTYTYLEMIFELNARFGCEKFIIFLPRTSILESVKQNINLSANHFKSIYGKQIAMYEKNINKSKKNNNIINNGYFRNKGEISVLLLMAQSIKSDKNLLNKSSERFIGLFNEDGTNSILSNIAALKPICILDEPHLLSGDAFLSKFIKNKNDKAEFKDCLLVRFGATFKKAKPITFFGAKERKKDKKQEEILELSNVAYILDSKIAFKEYLVKQICVNNEDNAVKEENKQITNNLDINRDKIDKNAISTMIHTAIKRHFEKEEKLFKNDIKALSLFFIENISDFRGEEPFVKNEFERLYKLERERILNTEISKEYREYLECDFDEKGTLKVLGGYFSGDKKTADENEKIAVDMILKDKLKLLNLKEPLRFLFSVWALQEGWDNPNIFTLTKLAKTSSEISARQQVGRGLRLCVNNKGTRITKEFCGDDNKFYDLNCLDVIVGADESNFIDKLQKEINDSSYILELGSTIRNDDLCTRLNITQQKARKILDILYESKVIDENNKIIKPLNEALEDSEISSKIDEVLGDGGADRFKKAFTTNSQNNNDQIKSANSNDNIKIKANLAMEFKELWQSINKHANMQYKNINENKLIEESAEILSAKTKEYKSVIIARKKYNEQTNEIEISKESLIERKNEKLSKEKIKELILNLTKNQKLNLPIFFTAKLFAKIIKDIDNENLERAINYGDLSAKIAELVNKYLLASVGYEFGANYDFSNDDLLFNNKGEPRENIKKSALGKNESDKTPAQKYMYEKIIYDSAIESEISSINENIDLGEIKVFAKLPSFAIPTPVGDYFPDFAYVIKNNNGEQIFFVCETKGYDDENNYENSTREKEKIKINCARKFFESLANELKDKNIKIVYEKRLNKENLNDILRNAIK